MAAGNAESETNGVTGAGGIEVHAHVFRDSGLTGNSRFLVFHPLSPVTTLRYIPGCHFLFPALYMLYLKNAFYVLCPVL